MRWPVCSLRGREPDGFWITVWRAFKDWLMEDFR